MPTKSRNIEKGREKDDKGTRCHPQEDNPIGEVKDSDIMNKTPNVDSKNEVIDRMAPGLKPRVNKSEWISSRSHKKLPRLEICEPEKKQVKLMSDESEHIANKKQGSC